VTERPNPPRQEAGRLVCDTQATRVTLFEDRAEVRRRALIPITQPGALWVALEGVTPLLEDRSLQAAILAGPPARILGLRARRRMVPVGGASAEEIDALEAAAREATVALHLIEGEQQRVQGHLARLALLTQQWVDALAAAPATPDDASAAPWRAAWAALQAEEGRHLDALSDLRAQERRHRAAQELAQARLRAARTQGPSRMRLVVEVQLDPQAAGELSLELRYRAPCALWRPEHLLSLLPARDNAPRQLEIVTYATAWQRTGEDWDGVEARFSTARPASAASAPFLEDDLLWLRRKTEAERQRIVVEAREQVIQVAGLDGRANADELPGVDDGGEPLELAPDDPIRLPSDGEPRRFAVARAIVEVALERVLMPEKAEAAWLRARWTWQGPKPLLAGPARLVRDGSFVGLGRLDFVGQGEVAQISMGRDDALRVRRRVTEKEDRKLLSQARHVEREVEVFLSNLSDQPRRVLLTERVPVSEIEAVQCEVKDAEGWRHDKRDGFLEVLVDVGPRQTARRKLRYEIRAPHNASLPF
jgi:uncharacterized protein (TIGR02231 family)